MKLEPKHYDVIFKEVLQMAEQYFNYNPDIQALYKKPVSIKFEVSSEYNKRPYSKRISDNDFIVSISKDWLDELWNYANNLSQDSKFLNLIESTIPSSESIRNYLFYFYVDLIVCHEWAHIFCGHLDFKNECHRKNNTLFSNNEYKVAKALELEADSIAARIILARLAANYENISSLVYSSANESFSSTSQLWKLFSYSLVSIFNFSESENSTSHPIPIYRIYTSIMFAVGEIVTKPSIRKELPSISDKESEVYAIFMSYVALFYMEYKNYSQENFEHIMFDAYDHCSKIGSLIKEIKLNDYRLINYKWT